jgi:hypothetical protein
MQTARADFKPVGGAVGGQYPLLKMGFVGSNPSFKLGQAAPYHSRVVSDEGSYREGT